MSDIDFSHFKYFNLFVYSPFVTWPYNKQLFSQHHNTIFGKGKQLKQKLYITCKKCSTYSSRRLIIS